MDIKQFVSKIYAFSKVGIKYSKDPYALENYHELKVLAEQQMHEENYLSEAGILYPKDDYPTPSVSVRVLVFKAGKLLMVQEKDDLKYCVPGGWCDVFESPKEAAIKEVEQETGLKVRIVRVLGIFMRDKYKPKPSMDRLTPAAPPARPRAASGRGRASCARASAAPVRRGRRQIADARSQSARPCARARPAACGALPVAPISCTCSSPVSRARIATPVPAPCCR